MNKGVQRLYEIAGKPRRRIIGLMSGTSLDGLDIACCEIAGSGTDTDVRLTHFATVPYPVSVKEEIRKVFAKDQIDFRHLCLLNPWLAGLHAQWILQCLQQWQIPAGSIDLIASHGQTVYHAPRILHGLNNFPDATLQIGDGDHIAVKTGIITLSDFRQKHIAAGGEGAPLALYGDYCVFSQPGQDRIMLNMGGIANFTYLPGNLDPRSVFVTDTGPGNTLIDAFSQRYFQQDFDRDALLARQGKVNTALLNALKTDPFFQKKFPRTTGPELFNTTYVEQAMRRSGVSGLSPYDVIATLTRFSADTIAEAIVQVLPDRPGATNRLFAGKAPNKQHTSNLTIGGSASPHIYLSGGGAHNPQLIAWIQEAMPDIPMHLTDELGISADAKEAVLFAILANEAVCGGPVDFGNPGMPTVTMGKISFPC